MVLPPTLSLKYVSNSVSCKNMYLSLRPPAVVSQNGSRLSHIQALADGERLAIVERFER